MERFLQTNTLSGKSHGRMRKAYCLSSAVHHLDSASLHLDGGRSPYMNRNLLSMECKHSKPSIFYSCTAHFSTIIVPNGKKQARKCPFYRLLRAFENYSNSSRGFYRQLINADISYILGTSISQYIALFASFFILLVAK